MTVITSMLTSSAATLVRGAAGHRVVTQGRQPTLPLELYEFEGCPHCRRVREALSALDLDVVIYPCVKNSRHRDQVKQLGGKIQFPFLVDKSHQTHMYESAHIVRYLSKTYGKGATLWQHRLGKLSMSTSLLASGLRARHGMRARGGWADVKPLHLWSYEASPYCRLVREVLSELEIPYHLHNVARGSAKRDAFVKKSSKMQVPYLEDPNTDQKMFESQDIIRYLNKTYAVGSTH